MLRVSFKKYIFILLFISFGTKYFAQQSGINISPIKTNLLFAKQTPMLFFTSNRYTGIQTDYSFATVFHATKRPMFCRMEDNLHKRFNIWIVLRAGSDAEYKKLIGVEK